MTTQMVSIAQRPYVWWRFGLSIVLLVGIAAGVAAREVQTPVQIRASISAVNGGTVEAAKTHAVVSYDVAGGLIWVCASTLVVTWLMWAVHFVRFVIARPRAAEQIFQSLLAVTFLPVAGLLTGCGEYHEEKFEEVAPNETAFVIPLSGSKEEQEKFKSLDYLKSAKVSAKRIQIPTVQHNTGYGPTDYNWMPMVKVIKVDRSPITREWTKKRERGSSAKDQAIAEESLESIGFSAGATITVTIKEEDAPTFLYYYFGKKLDDVVDQNVRSFVQMVLSREFGNRNLSDCMKEKAKIFDMCFTEAKALFAQKGITIEYLGSTEGLEYDDPKIQEAINKKFVAQNDIMIAQQEALAAGERNKIAVAKAQTDAEIRVANARADAEAAEAFVRAGDAMILKAQLDIAKAQAEAMKTAAEKWKGDVPANILPSGTNMMFGLDRQISANELPRPTTRPVVVAR